MPSWPALLHLGSPPSNNGPSRPKSSGLRSPPYQDQSFQDLNHSPLHRVPVLASPNPIAPSPPSQRPVHERSHSHPLSSIFGSGRKADRILGNEAHNEAIGTLMGPSIRPSSRELMAAASGAPSEAGENDVVTGKCATCDSLVRWPGYLDVFRCTVCLMVNDLKPLAGLSTIAAESGNGSMIPARTGPSKKVARLSLETTRNLVDEGLRLFLQQRLEQGLRHKSEALFDADIHASSAGRSTLSPARSNTDRSHLQAVLHPIPSPTRAPPPPPASLKFAGDPFSDNQRSTQDSSRYMFRLLENYIKACFSSVDCLNVSFLTYRPQAVKAASEGNAAQQCTTLRPEDTAMPDTPCPDIDAKTLLLGDFAENGIWWTGRSQIEQHRSRGNASRTGEGSLEEKMNSRSPRINWADLNEWYHTVISVGRSWRERLQALQEDRPLDQRTKDSLTNISAELLQQIDAEVVDACAHVQRVLLKATENLLRRPGRPLKNAEDCRFLIILLSNPLLSISDSDKFMFSSIRNVEKPIDQDRSYAPKTPVTPIQSTPPSAPRSPSTRSGSGGRHSGIIKRILGLLANLPVESHQHLVSWFSRFSEAHLRSFVDLVGGFVTYRLSRQHGRKRSSSHDPSGGLVPSITGLGAGTSAHLHAALGVSVTPKSPDKNGMEIFYHDDWQMKAAARVMSLLFSANIQGSRVQEANKSSTLGFIRPRAGSSARNRTYQHGQLLPTHAFYNTLLDYSDLVADFEIWESRRGTFSFCQYPMFLSIWAKIRIMEHDARRQMEIKAREAFFNSIMNRKAINQYLVLKVRRDCLVEDSLRGVSEVVGQGQEEIKKGLRIEFKGEEGLDSGGLRKEWFLLLVREVFDQEHGLFVYDEESQYCYFNPNTFETSDQFFLVGVLLGLAIYNSTILDVALPSFAFRKLLASAPNYTGPSTSSSRPAAGYTLEDLAEYRPSLANGLGQMLEFDGNVEETFCQDFVAVVERYGQRERIPLCLNGERRSVTNSNRREFVDLYIRYLLDKSVARQYEPFKRGFFTVCGGNALSLFRPEEIELLVRGSDEPLDVATLRSVAIYDGWGKGRGSADEPVVTWFWEAFGKANAKDQRKVLSFITASDRIPAMGATSLIIKISCLGDDSQRFPIARTCFNMLGLYKYSSREVLEDKLWRAVVESEGFGMK